MTTETLLIRLCKAALTTANSRRPSLRILVLLVAGGLALSGCTAAQRRPEIARPDLLKLRTSGDEQGLAAGEKILQKLRFWVIFNNQFRPLPQVTPPNWPAVIQRSLETSTRAATATAVRHLYAMAEISRLKRKADVEVRIVSIPSDWFPPVPGIFIKETMNNLADLGEKMGADPASWSTDPPH